jgi:antitoxin component HigA of HigAB toxin-antitoxin module
MSQATVRQKAPVADYLKLIRRFVPRRLVTAADQAAAMEAIRELAVIDEGKLSPGQQYYLDAMTVLLEDYDRRHVQGPQSLKGLKLLQYLIDEHGLTPSSLAVKIGVSQPLMARVLAGDRSISLKLMGRLADYFGLRAAAFLS